MCRHVGYVGPTTALAPILTDLDHSLLHQAARPREMLAGLTGNADGFGVAWYNPDVRPEPARYANPFPIWSDADLPGMGQLISAPLFIAAIRNATVAGTNNAANNAPFVTGRWSWSHNGFLTSFLEKWRSMMMRDWISEERLASISGVTDSEWLFHAFLTRLDRGEEPILAMKSLLEDVRGFAQENGIDVQLNILASDGNQLLATRDGSMDSCNSLYHLHDGEEFPDAHLVASEPLMDDPEWAPVERGTLMVLRSGAPPVRLSLHA